MARQLKVPKDEVRSALPIDGLRGVVKYEGKVVARWNAARGRCDFPEA